MTQKQFQAIRCSMHGIETVMPDSAQAPFFYTHDQFGIGVIVRGKQKSFGRRGMVRVETGGLINPGEMHDGSPLGVNGRAWTKRYFDPAASQ